MIFFGVSVKVHMPDQKCFFLTEAIALSHLGDVKGFCECDFTCVAMQILSVVKMNLSIAIPSFM